MHCVRTLLAGVASDAGRLEFSRTWRFNSTNTNASGTVPNALGLPLYVLPVAPFNGSHGDLYTAEVFFQAHEVFQGVPGQNGGGGGGACQGSASFWYGGNRSRPFFGDGGGGGNGGQAGERLRWEFSVQGRHVFEAGLQAEEAGLSSASYASPRTRQCGMGLCAMAGRATGICEAVCRNETAAELTTLSWQPSAKSDQSQLTSTLCMYEMTGEFEEVLVTLEVNLSLVYHFQPRAQAPRLPPSPQLPGGPPPQTTTSPPLPPVPQVSSPVIPPPVLPSPSPSPPSPSPRTPQSPPAFPTVPGSLPGNTASSVAVTDVLPAVCFALVVGVMCCCRLGRQSRVKVIPLAVP